MLTCLLRLARLRPIRGLASWMIGSMSFALPVQRLRETPTLIAFHHPRPNYRLHILLMPKQPVSSLTALAPANTAFLQDLVAAVQSLVAEFGLEQAGYRLITNGGPYQDVPHLHFHLVSGEARPQ